MKKKNIVNLIRYHVENNEIGFKNEAAEIAKEFDLNKDSELAKYIMSLISNSSVIQVQEDDVDLNFIHKIDLEYQGLPMPKSINDDIEGVINAINLKMGINKFLFYGLPGTGKTETAKQLARLFNRELFIVDSEQIVDSKLGQTPKNIISLFEEINRLNNPDKIVILFDEIDTIALNRIDRNDLREMGRATSTIFKGLDKLNENIVLIATTNLFNNLDKALIRRFDYVVDFNRYNKKDLEEVGIYIYNKYIQKFKTKSDVTLFKKILTTAKKIPFPGELDNLIKTSIAFSGRKEQNNHLVLIYKKIMQCDEISIEQLVKDRFTTRQIQTLTGISKSKVARDIKKKVTNE